MKWLLFAVMLLGMLGCSTLPRLTPEMVKDCILAQIVQYDDICAEESNGYEWMKPWDAHRAGVQCGVVTVAMCLDLERRL